MYTVEMTLNLLDLTHVYSVVNESTNPSGAITQETISSLRQETIKHLKGFIKTSTAAVKEVILLFRI